MCFVESKVRRQWFVGNRCHETKTEARTWRLINWHLVGRAEGHRTDENINCVSYFSTVIHVFFFSFRLSSEL